MKKKIRLCIISLVIILFVLTLTNSCKNDDNNKPTPSATVKDIDGNIYDSIQIGTQVWMKQNLKVTHYSNSDPIPNITDSTAWSNLTTGAYCDYENKPINSYTYGKLYNGYSVADSHHLCPTGWHIPSDSEWTLLVTYLGGENIAGDKLKEAGKMHWGSLNTANNESGFTALPGGCRYFNSPFGFIGEFGNWWSSPQNISNKIPLRYMNSFQASIGSSPDGSKNSGFSVRCIKD